MLWLQGLSNAFKTTDLHKKLLLCIRLVSKEQAKVSMQNMWEKGTQITTAIFYVLQSVLYLVKIMKSCIVAINC